MRRKSLSAKWHQTLKLNLFLVIREISCFTRWQVKQIMKQTFWNAHMSLIVFLVTKRWKEVLFCGKHALRTLIRRGTITNGESFLKRETGVQWRHCSKPTFRTGGVRVRVRASHVKVNGASLCGRGAVARTHFMPDLTSHSYTRTCMPIAMLVCNRLWRNIGYSALLCPAYFDKCTIFGLVLIFH